MNESDCKTFLKSLSLIEWFWNELEVASNKNYRTLYSFMKDGTYQSGTEELIELSSNPEQMRSFLLIGICGPVIISAFVIL